MISLPITLGSMTKGLGSLPIPRSNAVIFSTLCCNLNGTDEALTAADNAIFDFNGAFSVSAWIYVTGSLSAYDGILTKWDSSAEANQSWGLYLGASGTLIAEVKSGSNLKERESTAAVSSNTWTQVGMAWSGAAGENVRVYINGAVQAGTDTANASFTTITNSATSVAIGARYNTTLTGFLPAKVDDVSIWSADIGDDGMAEIYGSGIPNDLATHTSIANIAGWWLMGESASGGGSSLTIGPASSVVSFTGQNMTQTANVVSV